jgi:hypothetical protein
VLEEEVIAGWVGVRAHKAEWGTEESRRKFVHSGGVMSCAKMALAAAASRHAVFPIGQLMVQTCYRQLFLKQRV